MKLDPGRYLVYKKGGFLSGTAHYLAVRVINGTKKFRLDHGPWESAQWAEDEGIFNTGGQYEIKKKYQTGEHITVKNVKGILKWEDEHGHTHQHEFTHIQAFNHALKVFPQVKYQWEFAMEHRKEDPGFKDLNRR